MVFDQSKRSDMTMICGRAVRLEMQRYGVSGLSGYRWNLSTRSRDMETNTIAYTANYSKLYQHVLSLQHLVVSGSSLTLSLFSRPAVQSCSYFKGFSFSSKIPSLTSSSGFGLFWIFCSRLSARMCFSRSRWLACNAGAAVLSGRMLPAV